jgi:acyl-CoA thioesterase
LNVFFCCINPRILYNINEDIAGGHIAMIEFEALKKILQDSYDANPFALLLQMKLTEMEPGRVIVEMPVVEGKHTNLHGFAHGGALASLADTAMGAVCATYDKKVVTLNMSMNYIKPALAGGLVKAVARVVHNGRSTLVVEASLYDQTGILLAKSTATFYVVGNFYGSI